MDREDRDALIARYLPAGWHLEDELALLAVQSGEKQSVMEQRLQVMDHYIKYTLSGADALTAAAAELGVGRRQFFNLRSDERRVGTGCVSTGISRGWPCH